MSKNRIAETAQPAAEAPFVPTHGGVYRVAAGAVTVLEGGPPQAEIPAADDGQPKEGAA